jgi:hypothetical protein
VISALLLYLRLRTQEGTLTGDIFIVTNGAQNFKLGLIEVTAIPEDKMQQFIMKKEDAVRVAMERNEAQKVSAEKELETAQQEYDALKRASEAAEAKSNRANRDFSFAYSEADTDEAVRLMKQAESATKQAQDLKQKMFSKDLELVGIKSRIARSEINLENLGGEEFLFADLPTSDVKGITDAEGRFSIKLPTRGKFAIAARAQRNVFGSTEHYYWLMWVSMDGEKSKQIMLSNNNQLSKESSDSVIKIKDLLKNASVRQL